MLEITFSFHFCFLYYFQSYFVSDYSLIWFITNAYKSQHWQNWRDVGWEGLSMGWEGVSRREGHKEREKGSHISHQGETSSCKKALQPDAPLIMVHLFKIPWKRQVIHVESSLHFNFFLAQIWHEGAILSNKNSPETPPCFPALVYWLPLVGRKVEVPAVRRNNYYSTSC